MKKQEKIVKILSDGNIAKVGMIVTIIGYNFGNDINTITKIVEVACKQDDYPKGRDSHVTCLALNSNIGYKNLFYNKIHPNTAVWEEHTLSIRKATPEERKQYYAELYARNK